MWLVLSLVPAALYLGLLFPDWRVVPWLRHPSANPELTRRNKQGALIALGFAAAIALPVELLVHRLAAWLGVEPKAQITGDWIAITATLLLVAPLEEASKVAVVGALRSRFLRGTREGMRLGSAVALGFGCVEIALYLRGEATADPLFALNVTRAALAIVGRVFAGTVWGYALGRSRGRLFPIERGFVIAWTATTALRGLLDHLVFGRGVAALLGSMPLFLGMLVVSYLAAREMVPAARKPLPSFDPEGRLSFLPSIPPPPSLRAMRDALRRAERPVMLHWIVLGGLVTMGVISSCVVGAVILGRRLGVDFSAVDEGAATGAIPLAMIGLGVLLAFPTSGYLVARASGADSVLEPALSTGLAIAGTLLMLGLAAPVAVVFALAFAPVAFGLACAGAWVGIGAARG